MSEIKYNLPSPISTWIAFIIIVFVILGTIYSIIKLLSYIPLETHYDKISKLERRISDLEKEYRK